MISELAGLLEAAMGWLGGHLHAFEAGGMRYDVPDPDFDIDLFFAPKPVDERKAPLGDVLPSVKSRMRREYDFGDGWDHDIVAEAIEPTRPGVRYPVCLAGRRACPPEDCGGPWGYENMIAAMQDPSHPDHADTIEWLPVDFDPEVFNADETAEMMHSPRPLFGW